MGRSSRSGVLLGLTASVRYLTAYLLLIVPIVAVVLPALDGSIGRSAQMSLASRLWQQVTLCYRELLLLLAVFAIVYTLAMPVILSDFGLHSYFGVLRHFAHSYWSGDVRYFGARVSSQNLPWHYVYGYLLVQLPLFYHLFLLTFIGVCVVLPTRMWSALRTLNEKARTTLVVLLIATIIPFAIILIVRPVLYDGFRHVLFIVPLLCLLLYLGFVAAVGQVGNFPRGVLVAFALLFGI